MVSIASAVAAYANAAAAKGQVPGLEARTAPAASDFANLVKDAIGSVKGTLNQGEKLSLQAANGSADLTKVVTAVTNAEVALQTVVTVRDKVIQAYQDIIRMPL